MIFEKTINCSQCNKPTLVSSLRADPAGERWICSACYTIYKETDQKQKITAALVSLSETIQKRTVSPGKVSVKCEHCLYSFSAYPHDLPPLCPYCGKKGTINRIISTASLLKEVEEVEYFSKR